MATARIDAAKVIAVAEDKIAHHEAARIRAREEWFARKLRTPVLEGKLWWKRERYRTQAEVEAMYTSYPHEMAYFTPEHHVENRHKNRIAQAGLLRDLALASMDGSVSLNEDEARFLGLETAQ